MSADLLMLAFPLANKPATKTQLRMPPMGPLPAYGMLYLGGLIRHSKRQTKDQGLKVRCVAAARSFPCVGGLRG